MRAVDTNVLARYYLADDPTQSAIAKQVLEAGEVFVPKTVVLGGVAQKRARYRVPRRAGAR